MKKVFQKYLSSAHKKELRDALQRGFLLAAGLFALVWLLFRVIPKPSRITYPCVRSSAPLAMLFLAWAGGLFPAMLGIGDKEPGKRRKRIIWGISMGAVIALSIVFFGSYIPVPAGGVLFSGPATVLEEHGPLGIPRGIHPGRVVWAFDPQATRWDGNSQFWWTDEYTDRSVVERMLTQSLYALTGEEGVSQAWDSLFRYFNCKRHGEDTGYRRGEKIAVKINLNNSRSHTDADNEVCTSPQLLLALARSLVDGAGVAEEDLVFYDASRWVPDKIFIPFQEEFPNIRFVDVAGGEGREKAVADPEGEVFYSGVSIEEPDLLPTVVTRADYLLNVACLKKHTTTAVTFGAKNHFGSVYHQQSGQWTPRHLHGPVNTRTNPMGSPNPLVDLMAHPAVGEKTVLYLIDGIYGALSMMNVPPARFDSVPFNGHWSSSILVSQDGVAIESVALDMLHREESLHPNPDNYLHEASQICNPPSGTQYDPAGKGSVSQSLGVHEHAINDFEYSGNREAGRGIELITLFR